MKKRILLSGITCLGCFVLLVLFNLLPGMSFKAEVLYDRDDEFQVF